MVLVLFLQSPFLAFVVAFDTLASAISAGKELPSSVQVLRPRISQQRNRSRQRRETMLFMFKHTCKAILVQQPSFSTEGCCRNC